MKWLFCFIFSLSPVSNPSICLTSAMNLSTASLTSLMVRSLLTTLSTSSKNCVPVWLDHLCRMSFTSFTMRSKSLLVIEADALWQSLLRRILHLSTSSPRRWSVRSGSFPYPLVGTSEGSRMYAFRMILYIKLLSKSSLFRSSPGLSCPSTHFLTWFSWDPSFFPWRRAPRVFSISFMVPFREYKTWKRKPRTGSNKSWTAFAKYFLSWTLGVFTVKYIHVKIVYASTQ